MNVEADNFSGCCGGCRQRRRCRWFSEFSGCAGGTRSAKQTIEADVGISEVAPGDLAMRKVGTKNVVGWMVTSVVEVFGFIRALKLFRCVVTGDHGEGAR